MSFGALLLALHVLGAMVWVGGLFFALAVLRPGMAFLESRLRIALHEQVLRRFFFALWHVAPAMLVSGIAMEFLFYGGVLAAPWPMQAMTLSGLAMAAIFVVIVAGPWRGLQRAVAREDAAQAGVEIHSIRRLIVASLALGVFTTVVAVLDY